MIAFLIGHDVARALVALKPVFGYVLFHPCDVQTHLRARDRAVSIRKILSGIGQALGGRLVQPAYSLRGRFAGLAILFELWILTWVIARWGTEEP